MRKILRTAKLEEAVGPVQFGSASLIAVIIAKT